MQIVIYLSLVMSIKAENGMKCQTVPVSFHHHLKVGLVKEPGLLVQKHWGCLTWVYCSRQCVFELVQSIMQRTLIIAIKSPGSEVLKIGRKKFSSWHYPQRISWAIQEQHESSECRARNAFGELLWIVI